MIKEIVLASWPNMEDYLVMILILGKKYSIDDEEIKFVKGYGYALIGNPNNLYGSSTDHEYFYIN